jgi:hypothetical protein
MLPSVASALAFSWENVFNIIIIIALIYIEFRYDMTDNLQRLL